LLAPRWFGLHEKTSYRDCALLGNNSTQSTEDVERQWGVRFTAIFGWVGG
jgi:hypothetical protein